MHCTNCGNKLNLGQKFCTGCGKQIEIAESNNAHPASSTPLPNSKPFSIRQIITTVIVLGFIAFSAIASLDEDAINANNEGLTSFESGNNQEAIQKLQQASQDAHSNDTKILTLINLGYVQTTEGKNQDALVSFRQALSLTTKDSFEYFLISGEIDIIELRFDSALVNLKKAYALKPDDYQVNNSLALFYLDLEDIDQKHVDYKQALFHAKKANTAQSDSKITRENLGLAYFFNEMYSESAQLLIQSDLSNKPALNLYIGLSYAGIQDVSKARFYLQQAINAGVTVPQEVYDYMELTK